MKRRISLIVGLATASLLLPTQVMAASSSSAPQSQHQAPQYSFTVGEPRLSCGGDCYVEIPFTTNAPGYTRVVLQVKTKNGWRIDPAGRYTRARDGVISGTWKPRPLKFRVILKSKPRQVSKIVTADFDDRDVEVDETSGLPSGDP